MSALFPYFLPARASEHGIVIGLDVAIQYNVYKKIVIERTMVLIYLKIVATDFPPDN